MSATAIRPNGKPYTRRKPPTVLCEFDDSQTWFDVWAVVTRTHDVDEATAILWAFEGWEDNVVREKPLPVPTVRWVREAICMCGGDHAYDLIDDLNRGVPAVEFFKPATW